MGLYDDMYNVACPTCNSGVGVRCTVQKGKHAGMKVSVPHGPRQKLATSKTYLDAIAPAHEEMKSAFKAEADSITGSQAMALGALQEVPTTFAERMSRQERIEVVMFGIHFARNIMKIPTDKIDRQLAEMIVDGGLDGTR